MTKKNPSELRDWWPEILSEIPDENPQADKYITVAQVLEPWGNSGYRKTYTALVAPEMIKEVLTYPGGIGVEIETDYPYSGRSIKPSFSIWGGDLSPDGFEPLIYSWESNLELVLWPDPGFLMTNGLIPRWGSLGDDEIIYWDDVARPCNDVIKAKPKTEHKMLEPSDAKIQILNEYLQDYSTSRNMYLVQVIFAYSYGFIGGETKKILESYGDFYEKFPGRALEIRHTNFNGFELVAKVWLVRQIITPGEAPVFKKRWDYGELNWPDIQEPVTKDSDWFKLPNEVYIRDTVLRKYEGNEEFGIVPELGSVECGGQWSVGYSRRVGRDLIAVELRKLYEGVPSEVTKHWNKHSVLVSEKEYNEIKKQSNIASRTKRIAYSLCEVGKVLASLRSTLEKESYSCKSVVGINRETLEYYGWWRNKDIEPASRHVPLDSNEDSFFSRSKILYKLVVEGLSEDFLRKLAVLMGSDEKELNELGSIKLLKRITDLCKIAQESGLKIPRDNSEINDRLKTISFPSSVTVFDMLYTLRQLDSHRSGSKKGEIIQKVLKELGISSNLVASGWGIVLDKLYDRVGITLEELRDLFSFIKKNNYST